VIDDDYRPLEETRSFGPGAAPASRPVSALEGPVPATGTESAAIIADALSVVTSSIEVMKSAETQPIPGAPAPQRPTRPLGESELQIFPLVLGGGGFERAVDDAESFAILDAYVGAGGNAVDVPGGLSAVHVEHVIGRWLHQRGARDEVVLSTKVSSGDAASSSSAADVTAAVDASLSRLAVEHLDILTFDTDDQSVPLEESLTAADALVRAGKVRFLGASGYTAERLMEARVLAGQLILPRFVAVQVDYSLLARDEFERGIAPVAGAQGLAVLPTRVLGSGFLTGRYPGKRVERARVSPPRMADVAPHFTKRGLRIRSAVHEVARQQGVAPAAVALAWLKTKPFVTAPVVAASSREQIPDLLAAVNIHLTRSQVASLDKASD